MRHILKGSGNWLQTIDESEWNEVRNDYLEDEVRRLCEPIVFDPDSVPVNEEKLIGSVFVPSRYGTGKHLNGTMGNVMMKRMSHEDTDSFDVHVKVWTASGREPPKLASVHTWRFDSIQEAERFILPPSKNNFAWV